MFLKVSYTLMPATPLDQSSEAPEAGSIVLNKNHLEYFLKYNNI